jgi:hypothetical protein
MTGNEFTLSRLREAVLLRVALSHYNRLVLLDVYSDGMNYYPVTLYRLFVVVFLRILGSLTYMYASATRMTTNSPWNTETHILMSIIIRVL